MELHKWRRNEQILVNVLSLSVILVLLAVMSLIEPLALCIFLLYLLMVFMQPSFGLMGGRQFKWLVEVRTYEKQKLGSEWFKQKRSQFTSMIFRVCLFTLIFMLQGYSSSSTD